MNNSIKDFIKTAIVKTEISKKTNNPYTYLQIVFVSGYEFRTYLTTEQIYIFSTLSKKSENTTDDFLDNLMSN